MMVSFDVFIEIPQGSRNKYEYDFELRVIRFDRMVHTSMAYPANYGFVPATLAEDDDPLDVLVLSKDALMAGCVVKVRPIGVLKMSDEKGRDEKVLCVPVADPFWNDIHHLNQVSQQRRNEIEHFFKVYKDLENKEVSVAGWGDEKEAQVFYKNALERYTNSTYATKGDYKI